MNVTYAGARLEVRPCRVAGTPLTVDGHPGIVAAGEPKREIKDT